ncbi:putative uncharacterized protein [Methylocaldum marinum]|uniref:Uncharacterized protein n=1 Tax=Methylocaldum marinum TaxID=1432792 RepID=A0A250KZ94_9GAMM|nr:hypothetical protein [Methylocaldum marinum]BBA36912.1 putative uncharacterized protein [Methylocaldum marinum]
MKPAVCGVCGKSAIESHNGDWVTFSDYKHPDNEEIGHPDGLEWFCEMHLEEAKSLSTLVSREALEELRNRHPTTEKTKTRKENGGWLRRLLNRNE